jgi:hypothetical protein
MIDMGKTVESYRMALEGEISRWNGFARALRKDDREAFEELMDNCRNNAMAAGNATNPIIFEPMVMSILLAQQKRIRYLEQKLQTIQPGTATPSIAQEPKETHPAEPKITIPTVTSGGEQPRLN